MNIPLMIPDINDDDIKAVVDVLKSGMLVQGENVAKLESAIANYVGVKHAIAVSNGTASLHLALLALGIGKGDEVIVPAFSYVATANVVELVGATPIFVDIDINSFNIDTKQVEDKITSHTKAIIPVHEFGLACDISKVCSIAQKHNLKVIEDAACALGATENGKQVGSFCDIGSFSFHPRKNITSGEGGLLTTNNDLLAEKLLIFRNHGILVTDGTMQFVEAGFNYRLTDFQAALVLSQFNRFDNILEIKQNLAEIYIKNLSDNKNIKLPDVPKDKNHTWQSFHIIISDKFDRDKIISVLKDKGIGTNYGAQCIPFQNYYLKKYNLDCERLFPNALKAYKQGLVLPLFPSLREENLIEIINVINKTLA